MKKAVLYVHGRDGDPGEAAHYRPLFPDCAVLGADYAGDTPWDAAPELLACYDEAEGRYGSVILIANSIGAYFSMNALRDRRPESAFFISPVTDMEALIRGMMAANGTSEEELREKGTVLTSFGETLSWDYLTWVREHPPVWRVPTHVLYGERDNLIAYPIVARFAEDCGGDLTVMAGGEHWFHTEAQMAFLDDWVRTSLTRDSRSGSPG